MSALNKKMIIGLTGNIGTGKTTVAKLLEKKGIPVVDADQISRQITERPGPVMDLLIKVFGKNIENASGGLDREKLRDIVFKDKEKKQALEKILHPEILKHSRRVFENLQKEGHRLVVYEASLIIEAGRTEEFDGILMTFSDPEIQKRRVLSRNPSLTEEETDLIIGSQMPKHEKIKKSDVDH